MPTFAITQFTGESFSAVTFDLVFPDVTPGGSSSTSLTLLSNTTPGRSVVLKGTGFTYDAFGTPVTGTLTEIDFLDGTFLLANMAGFSLPLADFVVAVEEAAAGNDGPFDALVAPFNAVMDATAVTTEETTFDDTFLPLGDTAIAGAGGSYMELGEFTDTYIAGTGFDQIAFTFETGGSGAIVNLGTGFIQDTWGNVETLVTSAGKTFQSLRGSQYNDQLTGDSLNNHLRGLAGGDILDGGAGVDVVRYDRDVNYGGGFGVNVNLDTGIGIDGFGDKDTLINIENVIGSQFDDFIEGDFGDNEIRGLDGNDVLFGDSGNDVINPGDNVFGFDQLLLSDGNDTYVFSDANIENSYYTLDATGAPVSVMFNINGKTNTGSIDKGILGIDTLIDIERPLMAGGVSGGLQLNGGDVGDVFNINNDAFTTWVQIRSSAGNDTINVTDGTVVADYRGVATGPISANLALGTITGPGAEVGTDTITGALWEVRGTQFNDTLIGSANDESFIGFMGSDTIDGGAGFDRLRYDRRGVDAVTVDLNLGTATGVWNGAAFTDSIQNIEWVRGSRADNDTLLGAAGNERLEGRGGNDMLNGRGGDDDLRGEDGDDTLYGGGGNDSLQGGSGNDLLHGNAGTDTLDGGDGFDTASYANATGRVVVKLNAVADVGGGEGIDTFISIENVIGSRFNDRITGDAGDNFLSGGNGNDELIGLAGNDTLDGGIGDDVLTGSGGNDVLLGGNGFDTLNGLGGADTIEGGNGNDTITAGNGLDTVLAGGGNDTIFGNSGADMLFGDNGADIIRGGTAGDNLDGGNGDDRLYGGVGTDVIFGGIGNNVMWGGNGPASGDGKRDIFVFKSAALGGSTGADRILDFEDGTDKLDLSMSGYTSFADVLADASNVGTAMEINFDFGGYVVIDNFQTSDFNSGDVLGL